jgi:hypothetical protein
MPPSDGARGALAVLAVLAAAALVVGAAGGAKRVPARTLAAGMGHSCALTKGGGVRCYDVLIRAGRLSAEARASYAQTPGVTVATTRTIVLVAPSGRGGH